MDLEQIKKMVDVAVQVTEDGDVDTLEDVLVQLRGALIRAATANYCKTCKGEGRRWYSSTATWHGGMGGAAMRKDICDACWGTGRADKPGCNLRRYQEDAKKAREEAAAGYLVGQLGIGLKSWRVPLLNVAARIRKMRINDFWDKMAADHLADVIEKLSEHA